MTTIGTPSSVTVVVSYDTDNGPREYIAFAYVPESSLLGPPFVELNVSILVADQANVQYIVDVEFNTPEVIAAMKK